MSGEFILECEGEHISSSDISSRISMYLALEKNVNIFYVNRHDSIDATIVSNGIVYANFSHKVKFTAPLF